jgi:hypothetical protein
MNNFDDIDWGTRVLPGVDLTLWLRLFVALLLVVVAGGIAVATAV